jgi:hypothetical protein
MLLDLSVDVIVAHIMWIDDLLMGSALRKAPAQKSYPLFDLQDTFG